MMETSTQKKSIDKDLYADVRKTAGDKLAGHLIYHILNYDPAYDENDFDKKLADAEREVKYALLWKAYAGLPTVQKRILKQIVFKKAAPIEIAKKFGISLNTVYAHKRKALLNLRKSLGINQKYTYRTVKK